MLKIILPKALYLSTVPRGSEDQERSQRARDGNPPPKLNSEPGILSASSPNPSRDLIDPPENRVSESDEAERDEADEEGRGRTFHPGVESVAVSSDVDEVHDGEDERGDVDEDRPDGDEEVGERGVDDRWVASVVFEMSNLCP